MNTNTARSLTLSPEHSPELSPQVSPERSPELSLRKDTRGLSSVEYLILLVVIAIAGISVWKQVGSAISKKAGDSKTSITGLGGPEGPSAPSAPGSGN